MSDVCVCVCVYMCVVHCVCEGMKEPSCRTNVCKLLLGGYIGLFCGNVVLFCGNTIDNEGVFM